MIIKSIFTYLCIIILLQQTSQEHVETQLEKAFVQASQQNKNIFIIFTHPGCGWCRKMINNMNDESCNYLFERNYVTKYFEVFNEFSFPKARKDTPGAMEMLKKYKGEKAGIPFWVILDAKGKLMFDSFKSDGDNFGCPTGNEVPDFINILGRTSTMSEQELNIIADQFLSENKR